MLQCHRLGIAMMHEDTPNLEKSAMVF